MSLASQKGHIGLYLFCVYTTPELHDWFVSAWKATGKKLDMGKSCVRVKSLDAVPLEVVGELVRRIPVADFIASYERAVGPRAVAKKKAAVKKASPTKKASAKKQAAARSGAARGG
jgi:hypothetical protein